MKKVNIPKNYIVEVLENYINPANDRNVYKGDRLSVWESIINKNNYTIINRDMDHVPKNICKKLYELIIVDIENE